MLVRMVQRPALNKGQWAGHFLLYRIKSGKVSSHHQPMCHCQSNNHQSHNTCRKACYSPQNVDSRLKDSKEVWFTTACHDSECSVCRNPELNDSNGHVKAEQYKGSLIAMADTSLSPHAMMIELINTLSTGAAMWYSGQFVIIALITMPGSQQVLGIDNLTFHSLYIEQFR